MCHCEWSQVYVALLECVSVCVFMAMTTLTFQSACPALIPSPAVTAPGPPAE